LGVAGCGGGTGGDEGGGEGATNARLRVTWWGTDDRNQRTLKALDVIKKKQQGLQFATELSSGGPEYQNKISTQAAGGNAPDLFQTEPNLFAEFSQRNILLDLNQFVPDTLDTTSWNQEDAKLTEVDGKLLGVPMGVNSFMLLYDTAALERAKVGQPGDDWTWEDFERIANDVAKAGGEGYYGTEDTSGDSYSFEVFVRQRGKELFTESGKLDFAREDVVDWWTYWQELRESGAAVPAEVQALSTGDPTATPLATGKAAMEFDFSNRLIAFQGLTEGEVGYNVYPNGPSGSRPGMYIRPALIMCGYARTEHPEESATVINMLVNDPEVAKHLAIERGVPVSDEVLRALRPDLTAAEKEIVDYVQAVRENSTPMNIPRPPGGIELLVGGAGSLFSRVAQDVAFGKVSIEEGTDRFFAEAEGILA